MYGYFRGVLFIDIIYLCLNHIANVNLTVKVKHVPSCKFDNGCVSGKLRMQCNVYLIN